jgi:hypothetical protein
MFFRNIFHCHQYICIFHIFFKFFQCFSLCHYFRMFK